MKTEIFGQNKIFSHMDKINNWINNNSDTLITMEIDPTNLCNHKCPGCAGGKDNPNSLKENEMINYLNQM